MSRHNRDSYRPRRVDEGPPRPPRAVESAMHHFGSKQGLRKDFSFRSRIAERDLLTRTPTATETPVFASTHTGHKFRDVDNLTDSEEEAMEEDSEDDDDGTGQAKRRKVEDGAQDQPARWSNPDPYTALPPAQVVAGKRVDVVKLIRKARNEAQPRQNTSATEDDFISFGTLEDDHPTPPSTAPTGPRTDRDGVDSTTFASNSKKRKRGDFEADTLMGPRGRSFHANGTILADWRAVKDISPTPWLEKPSPTDAPMVALHKEILDFYAWVRPREFEGVVREDLIDRLGRELRRYKSGCQLHAFGSYAAGQYLPTGDMDLVCFLPNNRKMNMMPVSRSEMFRISSFLERSGIVRAGSMQVIAKAKVPILKFVDHATGLKVDMSFNNTTGTTAVETFKKWQATYPAVSILVPIIKQFLMMRGMNDNSVGGVGGFATICMVTSLVQNLPTPKHQNLGELLVEFFNLYGNLFDIRSVGIRLDPPGYIDKWNYPLLREEKRDRLMIVDPNRPDNNITGGSSEILRIFDLFSRTHEILQARLDDFADPKQRSSNFSFLEALVGGNFSAYYEQRRMLHSVHAASLQGSEFTHIPPPPAMPPSIPPPPRSPPSHPSLPAKPATAPGADVSDRRSHTGGADLVKNTQSADAQDELSTTGPLRKAEKRLQRMRRAFPEFVPQLAGRKAINKDVAVKLGKWKSYEMFRQELEDRERKLDQK